MPIRLLVPLRRANRSTSPSYVEGGVASQPNPRSHPTTGRRGGSAGQPTSGTGQPQREYRTRPRRTDRLDGLDHAPLRRSRCSASELDVAVGRREAMPRMMPNSKTRLRRSTMPWTSRVTQPHSAVADVSVGTSTPSRRTLPRPIPSSFVQINYASSTAATARAGRSGLIADHCGVRPSGCSRPTWQQQADHVPGRNQAVTRGNSAIALWPRRIWPTMNRKCIAQFTMAGSDASRPSSCALIHDRNHSSLVSHVGRSQGSTGRHRRIRLDVNAEPRGRARPTDPAASTRDRIFGVVARRRHTATRTA